MERISIGYYKRASKEMQCYHTFYISSTLNEKRIVNMEAPLDEISAEALKHFADPKNYGALDDANAVGTGLDSTNQNYATIYMKIENGVIEKASYVAHGSEDIVILGSILTEMIEGDTVAGAKERVSQLEDEVSKAYDAIEPPKIDPSKPEGEQVTAVSTQSQDGANIVLTAFKAALRHKERQEEGIEENMFTMTITKRCPYSNSDCAAMAAHS